MRNVTSIAVQFLVKGIKIAIMIAFRAFLISLANNEIDSFAGAINRARGKCWVRTCALARVSLKSLEIYNYMKKLLLLIEKILKNNGVFGTRAGNANTLIVCKFSIVKAV